MDAEGAGRARAAVAARGHWPTRVRRDSAQVRSRAPRALALMETGGSRCESAGESDACVWQPAAGLSMPPMADNGPRGGARSSRAR